MSKSICLNEGIVNYRLNHEPKPGLTMSTCNGAEQTVCVELDRNMHFGPCRTSYTCSQKDSPSTEESKTASEWAPSEAASLEARF